MTASSYVWRDEYDGTGAIGHDLEGRPMERVKEHEALAAATLITSPLEYARFLTAVMEPQVPGRPLNGESVAEMLSPQVGLTDSLSWGLGWGLQRSARGLALWHWGDDPGFKDFVLGNTDSGAGIVVMTNGDGGLAVCERVVREVFGGEYPLFALLDAFEPYYLE